MSDNKDTFISQLTALGLSRDEATVYLELLREPSTHLRLSRETNISRTKIYRLVDQLQKRSLVSHQTDDRGTFLTAAEPSSLEISIVHREAEIKQQRDALQQLIPSLNKLESMQDNTFVIRTYEGERGFRQMCWHELKTKGDLVVLGGGTIEELIPNHRWAEKHRQLTVESGYKVRDLVNIDIDLVFTTKNREYIEKQYSCRGISRDIISFDNQTVIYNDTVAIYHHRHEKKTGVEIISQTYANMMRTIFEGYWQQATPLSNKQ